MAGAAAGTSPVPTIEVACAAPLDAVVEAVCSQLTPGDVVLLRGPIGAGKTTLVQACAQRLGVDEPVTSPTFALAHRYRGTVPIAHLDLYRLASTPERDVDDLIAEVGGGAVAFVEWPETGAAWLPPAAVEVDIELAPDGTRRFTVQPGPARAA